MIDITRDIRPLTEFKRNTNALVKQMKDSGSPVVLTVNGQAEIVVQDAASYQRLMERVELADFVTAVRGGLADIEAGRVQDAAPALKALGKKLGA